MSESGNISPLHRLSPSPTSRSVDNGSEDSTTLYTQRDYPGYQYLPTSTGPTLYSKPNHRFDPYYVRPATPPESSYNSDPGWSPSPSPFEEPAIQRHRWNFEETKTFLDSLAQYMQDQKYKNARQDVCTKFSKELFWERFVEYMQTNFGRALTKQQYMNRLRSCNDRYDAAAATERTPLLEQAHKLDKAYSLVVDLERARLTREELEQTESLEQAEKKMESLASMTSDAPAKEIAAKETEELHKQGEQFKTRVQDMQTQFNNVKGELDDDVEKQLREEMGQVEHNFAALNNKVEAIIRQLQDCNIEKRS